MSEKEGKVLEFVNYLFTSGNNIEADRLVLMLDNPKKDLGGWCKDAIYNRVFDLVVSERKRVVEEVRKQGKARAGQLNYLDNYNQMQIDKSHLIITLPDLEQILKSIEGEK